MRKGLFAICLVLVVLITVLVSSCAPAQCTIEVKATLDGSPWSGAMNYTLTSVSGSPINGTTVANNFNVACGTWICTYVSGGPSGAYLANITSSTTQSATGSTITFTLSFTTLLPPLDASVTFISWTINRQRVPPGM